MGYYIEGPVKGKSPFIKSEYDGEFIPCPKSFDDIPEDKALICVIDNGLFEAAGYCFDEREFQHFTILRKKAQVLQPWDELRYVLMY